jgi:hypothetical protein
VACTGDGQCSGTTPHCDLVTFTCVQCRTGADCPTATPLCDPATFTCRS